VPALGIAGLSLSLASIDWRSDDEFTVDLSLMDSSLATRKSRTSACRRSTPSTRKMPHNLSSARKSLSGAAADAADAAGVVVDAAGEAAEVAEAAAGPGVAVGFVRPDSSGLIEFDCSKALRPVRQLGDVRRDPPRVIFDNSYSARPAVACRRVAINHWLSFKARSHSNVVKLFC
jgi:hypothetical protein